MSNLNSTSYLLTFTEGILTFISPCILPMLPIYFLYLAGTSEKEDVMSSSNKNRLLINSIGFVIGFTLVYIALGATVTSLAHFLAKHRNLLRELSGLTMIVFGLHFIGILRIGFLNTEKRMEYKFNKLKFISSIVFGMVFGFGWTPCIGYYLGSALALAVNSKNLFQGILLLLLYSIGLGIPFILSSILFDKAKDAFLQIQKHSRLINVVSGILLVAAGIIVFTDSFKYIRNLL